MGLVGQPAFQSSSARPSIVTNGSGQSDPKNAGCASLVLCDPRPDSAPPNFLFIASPQMSCLQVHDPAPLALARLLRAKGLYRAPIFHYSV